MTGLLTPLLLLLFVLATDAWVYADARRCTASGTPVFLRAGRLAIDTTAGWFLGCLVLWIVFLPLYLVSRADT